MYTLEEVKQRLKDNNTGFDLYGDVAMDGEFVKAFTISRVVDEDVLLFCYFWDSELVNYISYFY